jgi:diaminohydroxyphosphoribosylaminopyrimidine deaminase / 5-amino-6-(5-phosphoribosylamino)uracil reductase
MNALHLRRGGPILAGSLARAEATAAKDLYGRASEDGTVQPDVWFGDLDADGLHWRVIFQDRGGHLFGHRLAQVDGRTLDDLPCPPVDLAVVDRLRQVIGEPCGPQVEKQLDVQDKGLAQFPLGGQCSVAAVKDHALEQYPVLAPTHMDIMTGRNYLCVMYPARANLPATVSHEERVTIRPVITVSYAQTLDGRLATTSGGSRWISSPESLRFTHALRSEHDAIVVGAGTACMDDPRLTVRLVPGKDPLRVVVDSSLRTPLSAAVLADGAAKGTVLAVTERAPAERCYEARCLGATVLQLPTDAEGRVDLNALLSELYVLGVGSAMVEGGASLITSFLGKRLVDRLTVCIAPKILGSGIEAVGDLGICELADSLILSDTSFVPYGVDIVLDSRVEYPDGPR